VRFSSLFLGSIVGAGRDDVAASRRVMRPRQPSLIFLDSGFLTLLSNSSAARAFHQLVSTPVKHTHTPARNDRSQPQTLGRLYVIVLEPTVVAFVPRQLLLVFWVMPNLLHSEDTWTTVSVQVAFKQVRGLFQLLSPELRHLLPQVLQELGLGLQPLVVMDI
jgi:hypothetical protein